MFGFLTDISRRIGHNSVVNPIRKGDFMDRRQLPLTAEPDNPARATEARMAERSAAHERRNEGVGA